VKKYIAVLVFFIIAAPALTQQAPAADNIETVGDIKGTDNYTYLVATGKQITVAWDPDANATKYEIQISNHQRQITIPLGEVTVPQITLSLPKSGHWVIEARACNAVQCSDWANSEANGRVNGADRAWWVHAWMSAPTGGGITLNRASDAP
jgi:hypothetical protein